MSLNTVRSLDSSVLRNAENDRLLEGDCRDLFPYLFTSKNVTIGHGSVNGFPVMRSFSVVIQFLSSSFAV